MHNPLPASLLFCTVICWLCCQFFFASSSFSLLIVMLFQVSLPNALSHTQELRSRVASVWHFVPPVQVLYCLAMCTKISLSSHAFLVEDMPISDFTIHPSLTLMEWIVHLCWCDSLWMKSLPRWQTRESELWQGWYRRLVISIHWKCADLRICSFLQTRGLNAGQLQWH